MSADQETAVDLAVGQPGQAALFDYNQLEAEAQDFVRDSTERILTIAKRVTREMVEIGGLLVQVKDRITPTQFDAWVSTKLHWSERTVYNLMSVHLKFRDADFALENVAASALYLLAAPSTPTEAVEAVKEMANAGSVSHAAVKEIVQQAKEAQEAALRPALFVEPDAETCRCGHSDTQHDEGGCLVCECEYFSATSLEVAETETEQADAAEPAAIIPEPEPTLKSTQAAPVPLPKPEAQTPAAKPTKIAPTTDEMKLAAAQDACWRQVTVRLAVSLLPVKGDGPRTAMVNVNLPDHMDLMKATQVPEDQAPAKLEELTALVKAALYEKLQKTKTVKPAAKPATKPATKPAAKPAAKKNAARK